MSLQAHQLTCVRGDLQLFAGVSFALEAGDAMRVAGTNGSGKTSLLRMLAGLSMPDEGEVRWNGRDIRRQREEFCSKLVYLGHASGVKDDLLAWENLVIASTLAGMPVECDDALDALEQLGLERAAWLPTRALSQGQRKRVSLARLSLQLLAPAPAPLWILDEPFTALDVAAVDALCATLDRHLARGGMVIYTTHQEIRLTAQRLLSLDMSGRAPC
jgi:heme exporter protein A